MIHIFLTKSNAGIMPYSFMVIPILILFIFIEIFLLGKREGKFVESMNLIAAFVALTLSLFSILQISIQPVVNFFVGGWAPPYGVHISLFFLNLVLVLMTAFCFVIMALASKAERLPIHSYPLFLFMFIGAFGVLHSADLFNIFVYLEIMSIASYSLAAISESKGRWNSAFNYMIAGAMMTSFFLLGVVLVYGTYGTLNLYDLHNKITMLGTTPPVIIFALVCLLMTMFFKSAIFPFYFWKPAVMRNTNPAMTVFFGALSPIITFYISIRLLEIFQISTLYSLIFIMGFVTMAISIFLAIYSRNLMNVLAYASIFQAGLLFTAYGLGYVYPVMKEYSIAHMIATFVFEVLIFGSLALKRSIGANLAEKIFVLGLMGSVGMPLTAGFIPKIMMLILAFHMNYILAFSFLFFFVFSIAYALKAYTLYSEHHFVAMPIKSVSLIALTSLTLASVLLIILGLYPDGMIYISRLAIFSLRGFGV